jgi:preprotein translocase subunit Sss1
MTENSNPKSSSLPASATLLITFSIVTLVLIFVSPIVGVVGFVVAIVWSAKLLFDLVRWLRLDKDTRPKMKFPKKSAGVLFVVVLAVGYFVYLIARDLDTL